MTTRHHQFHLYDTTLRDGAQREGIRYSVTDKLAIARHLDDLGVTHIEGGWPGALPTDTEFFTRAADELHLKNSTLVAFGATRKAGLTAATDPQIAALVASAAPAWCLVAKSDPRHVTRALRTTTEENLDMIADTIAYGTQLGKQIFLDCEHFFDGYQYDPDYATNVVTTAIQAGADVVVLCDTNGGMLPSDITTTITQLRTALPANAQLGIHCQDDTACAVANTVTAVQAGVMHVQGTANGYGERPGNADIFAVIANLATKLNLDVIPKENLKKLTRVSHAIAEIANLTPNTHQPYVGHAAFAHKAGLHASAIKIDPHLYNHIDPETVGNDMRILVTEMAGRASIELKARELGIDLTHKPDVTTRVTQRIKEKEARGWSYEAADASFELLLKDELHTGLPRYFTLESYRVIIEHRNDNEIISEATVKLRTHSQRVIATAEGNGPVNALDSALRQALTNHYPELQKLRLADYKVRILDGNTGTDATTRVLVDTTDGTNEWTTVGVHHNVVEASWHALAEALTYRLSNTTVIA